MKRLFFVIFAIVISCASLSSPVWAQSDEGCTPEIDQPYACRSFDSPTPRTAEIGMLVIIVSDHQSPSQAQGYILEVDEAMAESGLPQLRLRGLPEEAEYTYTSLSLEEDGSSMGLSMLWVSFDHYVVSILTGGTAEARADDLTGMVADVASRATSNDVTLLDLLPDEDEIPYAMSLSVERSTQTSTGSNPSKTTNADTGITRTPRTSSSSKSQSKPSSGSVTRTERSGSSSSSTSSGSQSGGLKVADISTKDAGIGDGTVYVYIELENNSRKDYGYVQVDLVCRDTNDRVVATGIANELGLPAGGSTVLTGIIMSAPDCVRVEVKINPLSD